MVYDEDANWIRCDQRKSGSQSSTAREDHSKSKPQEKEEKEKKIKHSKEYSVNTGCSFYEKWSKMMEQWYLYKKRADFNQIGEKFNIDPVIARLIRNRDVVGDEQIQQYLYGELSDISDPF